MTVHPDCVVDPSGGTDDAPGPVPSPRAASGQAETSRPCVHGSDAVAVEAVPARGVSHATPLGGAFQDTVLGLAAALVVAATRLALTAADLIRRPRITEVDGQFYRT